jgi:hypothetical protein
MGGNVQSTTREDGFTTIRIRRTIRTMLEGFALPKEALWETVDRIVKEHAVARLKKVNEDEEVEQSS